LSLPLATLLAVPLALGLVLSTSRSAWIYVVLVFAAAGWTYWGGDRERLRSLFVFSSFVLVLFAGLNFVVAYSSWFPRTGAQGGHDEAARMLSRLAAIYPNSLHENLRRLEELARDDPAAFAALASEARRRYRP
jgi:hypothetical protein